MKRIAIGGLLGFVVLCGLSGGAPRAQGLPPRYDTNGLCFRTANSIDGFSPDSVTSCLATQSNAYNRVRRAWDSIAPALSDDCDAQTRATGKQDYVALENCLKVQISQNAPPPLVPLTKRRSPAQDDSGKDDFGKDDTSKDNMGQH